MKPQSWRTSELKCSIPSGNITATSTSTASPTTSMTHFSLLPPSAFGFFTSCIWHCYQRFHLFALPLSALHSYLPSLSPLPLLPSPPSSALHSSLLLQYAACYPQYDPSARKELLQPLSCWHSHHIQTVRIIHVHDSDIHTHTIIPWKWPSNSLFLVP